MDIAIVLSKKFAGQEWNLNGETYKGLTWLSNTKKPTEAELNALWPEVQHDLEIKRVEKQRARSYQETSDPIFFQYQRGDATKEEWLQAVQSVKDGNPYPVKP
jgi:hypothetical protein